MSGDPGSKAKRRAPSALHSAEGTGTTRWPTATRSTPGPHASTTPRPVRVRVPQVLRMHPSACRVGAHAAADGCPHVPTLSSGEDVAPLATEAPVPVGRRSYHLPMPSVLACSCRGRTGHKATARQTSEERTRPSAPGVSGSFGRPMRPWIREQSAGFTCVVATRTYGETWQQ